MTTLPTSPVTPVGGAEARPEPDLSRRLGRGGMAEVYLAEQLSLRRQVALKVLRQSLAGDDAYIRRFRHEAQAAAKLVHANIVQIYEVGCVEGHYYISQEYVPGQNLKQLLSRLGRGLDAVQAINIIRQVAAALHKAAEQKIIHRDIKPENIMISPAGEVKVADFGLARVVREDEALNLTQVGITMGTPLYMSPEQVEGRPVDPRSDLYSFGVTCYHMLAGHPPFDGDTALAVAVQHIKNEPQRLELLRPDLPEGLCRIVHKMLAKKPEDRYQRAIDLLKDLRALSIEGLDQDWTADLPGFASADLALSTAGRMDVTQQLDRLLKTGALDLARRSSAWRRAALVTGLIVLGAASGALLAWVHRPPSLLASSESLPLNVRRFSTVGEQYAYAQLATHNQEVAWRAVSEYFPPEINGKRHAENTRYSRLATKGLAGYYLSHRRFDDALALYQQLENVEDAEIDFKLAGIAGQALVYDRMKLIELDLLAADQEAAEEQPSPALSERIAKRQKEVDRLDEQVRLRLPMLRTHAAELPQRLGGFLAGQIEKLFEEYERPETS
jgi:serine/threonine-protein kinase